MQETRAKIEQLLISCLTDAKALWNPGRKSWDKEDGTVSDSEFNKYIFKLNGILHTIQIFIGINEEYIQDMLSAMSNMLFALDSGDTEIYEEVDKWMKSEFDWMAKQFK